MTLGHFWNCSGKPLESLKHGHYSSIYTFKRLFWLSYEEWGKRGTNQVIRRLLQPARELGAEAAAILCMVRSCRMCGIIWWKHWEDLLIGQMWEEKRSRIKDSHKVWTWQLDEWSHYLG